MRRQEFNVCQAGHDYHDTKVVDTVQGPFTIFDWDKYMGFAGYCTGQDDVSMSLELYGSWEADDWERALSYDWEPGTVMDFGSHIGWYTMPLAQRGHRVFCVDADETNTEVLLINARNRRLSDQVIALVSWVEDLSRPTFGDVRFIKSDVEGSEDAVIEACWEIITIQHPVLLLECSPEFGSYYPQMMQRLIDEGYEASLQPEELETQANVWFE